MVSLTWKISNLVFAWVGEICVSGFGFCWKGVCWDWLSAIGFVFWVVVWAMHCTSMTSHGLAWQTVKDTSANTSMSPHGLSRFICIYIYIARTSTNSSSMLLCKLNPSHTCDMLLTNLFALPISHSFLSMATSPHPEAIHVNG